MDQALTGEAQSLSHQLYMAERSEAGIVVNLLNGAPESEPNVNTIVVAGLKPPEDLAREAASVHFSSHPSRNKTVVIVMR